MGLMSDEHPKIEHVAGLDTSSSKFHLYRADPRLPNGDISFLTLPDKMDPDERRHKLFDQARITFSMLPTNTLIVCERPMSAKNPRTNVALSLAAGTIWAAHLYYSVFWTWVDIPVWKKEVVGNGNATKEQVVAWVQEHLGLEFPEEEPDLYDAAAIARWGELKVGLA